MHEKLFLELINNFIFIYFVIIWKIIIIESDWMDYFRCMRSQFLKWSPTLKLTYAWCSDRQRRLSITTRCFRLSWLKLSGIGMIRRRLVIFLLPALVFILLLTPTSFVLFKEKLYYYYIYIHFNCLFIYFQISFGY